MNKLVGLLAILLLMGCAGAEQQQDPYFFEGSISEPVLRNYGSPVKSGGFKFVKQKFSLL